MATDTEVKIDRYVAADWDPETDNRLVCMDVHDESHDVKSFTLASPLGKAIAFEAGQYFLFESGIDEEENGRCYSVSSSPLRQNAITVTVKRVAGGKVSNWLHDNLKPGMELKASGPMGKFIRPKVQRYLMLSGGSGITPLMAMVREMADRAEPVDVVFLHAGRTPLDLLFRDELSLLARRMKGLRLIFLPEVLTGDPSWPGLSGRISKALLDLVVPDVADRSVLCCGPAPFMAAARVISSELGVPPERYLEESFDAAAVDDVIPPMTVREAVAATYQVQFAKQGKIIDVRADQTVLACAKKMGVRLPSSCSNGICGTCKSKLVSGSVEMKHEGGIRQREIDAGFFLPCCSKPLSDLVIDR